MMTSAEVRDVLPSPFKPEQFSTLWHGLTEDERQWVRDKAQWEHMSLSAVLREWGVPDLAAAREKNDE